MAMQPEIPDDLLQRFQTQGFTILKLSATSQAIVDSAVSAAQFYFRSSLEDKLKGRLPNDLGYRGFGEDYSQTQDRPDQIESFSASLRGLHLASYLSSGLPLILYTRMLATINIFEAIAEAATKSVAKQLLGHDMSCQIDGAFRWWSFLQINYSFPSRVTTEFINDLHEDGCLMTVATATAPGLEVQLPDGSMAPVTTSPDEVLVMPGEILWLLSGGAVKPLHHRVRPHRSYAERAALLYFGDIAPELCQPWILNEINQNVDIGDRVLKNPTRFGLEEWTP